MKEDSIPVLTQILAIPTPPEYQAANAPTAQAAQNLSAKTAPENAAARPTQATPSTSQEAASRYSPAQLFSRLGNLGNLGSLGSLGNLGGLSNSMPQPVQQASPLQGPQPTSTHALIQPTAQPAIHNPSQAYQEIPARALPIEASAEIPMLLHPAAPVSPIAPTPSTTPVAPIPVLMPAPAVRPTIDAREIEAMYQNACAQITAQLTQELCANLEHYFAQAFQQVLPKLLIDLQQQVHHNLSSDIAAKIHLLVAQSVSNLNQPPSNQ